MSIDALFTADERAQLIALRRALHANPELSWHETATQARLEAVLRDRAGGEMVRVATTGLVVTIPDWRATRAAVRRAARVRLR